MATSTLNLLLRLGRPLLFFFLLLGLFTLPLLFTRTLDVVTTEREIRLEVNTRHPHFFSVFHAVKVGWDDGVKNQPIKPARGPLPSLQAGTTKFELATLPHTKLLRYEEPSAWKRLALLYLGASDNYLSLAWVIFFFVSSWWLWLLLLDVSPATPFSVGNARRLRNLGLLILGLAFLQEAAHVLLRALLPPFRVAGLEEPLSHYIVLNTDVSLPGWEVGFILLIIAAVYQRGVLLHQEAELTV